MRCVSILVLAGLCFSASVTWAEEQDGPSVDEYLRRKGLTGAECLARSPHDLVGWIQRRQHLRDEPLTTGGWQTVIDHFYAHYRAALRPVIDRRYPRARALRGPLLDLHWSIYQFMIENEGYRSYVTRPRVAAFTEHEVAELLRPAMRTPDAPPQAAPPTREEVAAYARLTAKKIYDRPWQKPDPDQFAATLRRKLKTVEAAVPKRAAGEVRRHVMDFVNRHLEELNPKI